MNSAYETIAIQRDQQQRTVDPPGTACTDQEKSPVGTKEAYETVSFEPDYRYQTPPTTHAYVNVVYK